MLTCSALTGAGLDEVWSAVLEHREHLEAEGSLEVRRARQQQDWMWAMVDAHLHDAVRDAPSVRAERAEIERAVRAGELSAVDGTARILGAVRRRPHPRARRASRPGQARPSAEGPPPKGQVLRVRVVAGLPADASSKERSTGRGVTGIASGMVEHLIDHPDPRSAPARRLCAHREGATVLVRSLTRP